MHTQDTACAPGPGAAAAGMKEGALLTREQEQALGKRIREGDKAAMETMITHNLRLVKSIAKQYIGMGMDYDDLLQEGYIGLIAGTKKYDYTLGNKFSTYATWWIKQSITRALASKARMIRLPVHAGEEMNRIRKTIASLYNDLGRNPSEKEVAQKTGFSQEKVRMLMAYISSDTVSLDGCTNKSLVPSLSMPHMVRDISQCVNIWCQQTADQRKISTPP